MQSDDSGYRSALEALSPLMGISRTLYWSLVISIECKAKREPGIHARIQREDRGSGPPSPRKITSSMRFYVN